MSYKFGPHNPKFLGTDKEWIKLKETIAWWNEDTSIYPIVKVICPHCGTQNTHNISNETIGNSHHECDLMIDKHGKTILYDCPGYVICRYINTV